MTNRWVLDLVPDRVATTEHEGVFWRPFWTERLLQSLRTTREVSDPLIQDPQAKKIPKTQQSAWRTVCSGIQNAFQQILLECSPVHDVVKTQ